MKAKPSLFFGRHVLKEAIKARVSLKTIYVENKSAYEFVQTLFGKNEVKISFEEGIPRELQKESHQGVAFRTNHEFYEPYDIANLRKLEFIILCNHIEDVQNLGSIVRSAAALGAKAIVHEETKSASLTAGAIKSSAGYAFRLKFMKVPKMASVIQSLQKSSFTIAGLSAAKSSIDLYDWKPTRPLALVLGSESQGLESEVEKQCDSLVRIPMEASIDSLNVSHAASIAMSWVRGNKYEQK